MPVVRQEAREPRESGRGRGHKSSRTGETGVGREESRGTRDYGERRGEGVGTPACSTQCRAYCVPCHGMLCILSEAVLLHYTESNDVATPGDWADRAVSMGWEHEEDVHQRPRPLRLPCRSGGCMAELYGVQWGGVPFANRNFE